MGWQGWFTLVLVLIMLAGLTRFAHLADVIFLGGAVLLGLGGIISPSEVLSGFANPGMVLVAALFVVAAAMRDTGSLDRFVHRILGQPTSERAAVTRLVIPAAAHSLLLTNTTIVAMALPIVMDWCRKHRLSASRLLIPLDYATIAGGVCTLIGTSTNLVVHGLMINAGMKGMGYLEIGAVGLPITIATVIYLFTAGHRLLPFRPQFLERLDAERREFLIEMHVEPVCPFVGQSVSDAGLRQLPGLFLVEITRGESVIAPVSPDERIESGDRLGFAGVVSTIVDLQKTRGLTPVPTDPGERSLQTDYARNLCEAVVSANSGLVGRSIRDSNFRTVYDAAVIAVHRSGERLAGKIGDIVLRPGDTLLLQTASGFVRAHRNNASFYLVSEVGESEPVRHHKAGIALAILFALVVVMALPDFLQWMGYAGAWSKMMQQGQSVFAMAAALLMVIVGCLPVSTARRSIQWDTLLVIAASFPIAIAMEKSGMANSMVDVCMPFMHRFGPRTALALIYILTNVLTELLTNNAAAALVFPIALSTAHKMGIDPRPLVIAVAIAASGGFVVPIGYQTHMMVFGPGGYRLSDFVKVGLPLNILWFVVAMVVIPMVWPLALAAGH